MSKLTLKQRKFIDELFECGFNGTEAARRAGYKHARQMASENLSKPVIVQEINKRFTVGGVTADYIIRKFREMADCTLEDFLSFQEGGFFKLDLHKAKERGKLGAVKKLKYNSKGYPEIELYDRQAALTQIAKMYGLIEERLHVISEDRASEREQYYYTGEIPQQTD